MQKLSLKHIRPYSLGAWMLVCFVLVYYRVQRSDIVTKQPLKVTTWDAFGYYAYLPSFFIYNDATELKWLDAIDKEYALTGGKLYQANKYKNDQYVFKYLGGVAIMQAPFFFVGHLIAKASNYKADGFSPPYQYAIAFGAIFYCILSLLLLRNILLRYFSDGVVALTILLLVMATNLIQYVAIDGAMSHAYIFPLYVLILYATIKWHKKPSYFWTATIAFIIGLATICRPTEAVMLFIPLLWNMHNKQARKEKWDFIKSHKGHLLVVLFFGLLGILPQLIYWKFASGSFIYNVGSKWVFLTPFFRVLFGFTNGWFIYTPITIFFVLGFFYLKNKPFQRSVITFCLLNIWIVIAWFDWQYGATYSTRALVQSYPIFALAFAAIITKIIATKWKYLFFILGAYFIFLNLFQINQYYTGVLHYRDMNARYYAQIYLNNKPSPVQMSLLDTDDYIYNEAPFKKEILFLVDSTVTTENQPIRFSKKLDLSKENWLRIQTDIQLDYGFDGHYLVCKTQQNDSVTIDKIRLFRPLAQYLKTNTYDFYVKLPALDEITTITLAVEPAIQGEMKNTSFHLLSKAK